MIRLLLLFLTPFLMPQKTQEKLRARAALSLVKMAARLDTVVVVLASQAITMAAETTIVESLMREIDEEQAKSWPTKSTLN